MIQTNAEDVERSTIYYTQNAVMMIGHFANPVTYIPAVEVVRRR